MCGVWDHPITLSLCGSRPVNPNVKTYMAASRDEYKEKKEIGDRM